MHSQNYRDKAMECLLAAHDCSRCFREVHLSLAGIWLALARHDEAMNKLLASWDMAKPVKTVGAHPRPLLYLVK